MIQLKNSLRSIVLISCLVIASVAIFIGCSNLDDNTCISGEGTEETRTITVNDFTGIASSISSNITIIQGNVQAVKFIGHSNIIDEIKTEVVDDILEINFEEGCYKDFDLTIEITVPTIDYINALGGGAINIDGFESIENLELLFTGGGRLTVSQEIRVNMLELTTTGSGNVSGFNLISEIANVTITGSGDVELTTNNELNIDLIGSGNVLYKGTPTINQTIVGSGNVINAN